MMPLTSRSSPCRWLALAALLGLPRAGAALPPPPAPQTSSPEGAAEAPSADFAQRMPELMGVVEEYRGLRFEHPVPLHTISAAELGAKLAAGVKVGPRSTLGDVRTLEIGWKAFGLIPQSMDLADAYVQLTPDELAGFYDPQDKQLTLVTGPKSLFGDALVKRHGAALAGRLREGLALHELTHAVEDQHFGLGRLIRGEAFSDAAMARWTLVEGDATLVMLADFASVQPADISLLSGLLRQLLDHPERFQALTSGAPTAAAGDAPPGPGASLQLGYLEGASFCAKVLERGGQRLLDYAFRTDPPRSTEQILHPEKWLDRRDDPVVIAWPELRAELPGYAKAAEGELGELWIRVLLRQGRRDPQPAEAAAAGWGGDRFAVYRRPATASGGAATLLAWITDWDADADAARFADAAGALGADWQVERTAARRVVVLRGALAARERSRLVARLAHAPAQPAANRAVDPAAIDPQRRIGAAGKVTAARLAERRRQAQPTRPLAASHLGEDGRTYSYPEIGLSVRLPPAFAGWRAQTPSSPTILQYLTGSQGDFLTVSASDMHQAATSLEMLEPFLEKGMSSTTAGFAKLDGRVVEIAGEAGGKANGQRAYELRFGFTRGGVAFQRLQRLFLHGTYALVVAVEARADRWPEIEPSARELLAGVALAVSIPAGGTELLLRVRIDGSPGADARAEVVRREAEALRLRLGEALGDAASQVEERPGERIAVRLAKLDRPERVRQLVLAGGLVEFRFTAYPEPGSSGVERAEILSHYGGHLPADVEILESRVARHDQPSGGGLVYFAVETRRAVTSRDFSAVRMEPGASGQPVVTLTFQPAAARTLGDLTSSHLQRALAIVIDGKVMLAPILHSQITDSAMIEGSSTPEETGDLAIALRHPLPAAVQCLEERDILDGAKMGAPRPCR